MRQGKNFRPARGTLHLTGFSRFRNPSSGVQRLGCMEPVIASHHSIQLPPFDMNLRESKVKLNLEVCTINGEATVVYCRGRVAYGKEAAALSRSVAELLPQTRHLLLELSGVEMIDSAGLGELVGILRWARVCGCAVKLVAPRRQVRQLLELTNLASVFEIHSSLEEAAPGLDGKLVPSAVP